MVCSVPGCKTSSTNNPKNYSFHRFPEKLETRQKWLRMLNRMDWNPSRYSTICGKHFNKLCFEVLSNKRRVLRKCSVPTIDIPIPNDMENYSKYRVTGSMSKIGKPGSTPPKFGTMAKPVLLGTSEQTSSDQGVAGHEDWNAEESSPREETEDPDSVMDRISAKEIADLEVVDIIYRVFKYLEREYSLVKSVNAPNSCDLSPLSDVTGRAAAAVGVSKNTVLEVLKSKESEKEKRPDLEHNDNTEKRIRVENTEDFTRIEDTTEHFATIEDTTEDFRIREDLTEDIGIKKDNTVDFTMREDNREDFRIRDYNSEEYNNSIITSNLSNNPTSNPAQTQYQLEPRNVCPTVGRTLFLEVSPLTLMSDSVVKSVTSATEQTEVKVELEENEWDESDIDHLKSDSLVKTETSLTEQTEVKVEFEDNVWEASDSDNLKLHSMMEKNTDDSHKERKRQINDSSGNEKNGERNRKNRERCKRYREKKKIKVAALLIRGSPDSDEKKREEERKQKNREKAKRYRLRKKNKIGAVSISGPFDSDEEKRKQERKQRNRDKTRRYREKKKNEIEVATLSMATADSSSDSSATKMKQARQKQRNAEKCKRYREKKRTLSLQKQNISNYHNRYIVHKLQAHSPDMYHPLHSSTITNQKMYLVFHRVILTTILPLGSEEYNKVCLKLTHLHPK